MPPVAQTPLDPQARDRFVRRTRHVGRLVGIAAAGATALLSVVAAHAFKGHDGRKARAVAARVHPRAATARPTVPPPDNVPSIFGAAAPIQAPSAPPAAAAPAPVPQPAPETSGGS